MKNLLAAIVIAIGMIGTTGTAAFAGLVQVLDVTGDLSGSGLISFTTESGNSLSGVSDFFFDVDSPLALSFQKSDINDIEWSINASDWTLSLTLQAFTGSTENPGDTSYGLLLNNTGLPIDFCALLVARPP